MTSYFCPECLTNWAPYHCDAGVCPKCKTGTILRQEPVSEDAGNLHRDLLRKRAARERSEHLHREFEEYCAKRDAERNAAQPTEVIDTLEVLAELPPADDERRAA